MATQAATPSSSSALASSSTALLARLHPSLYLSNHLAHSSRPASSASSTKAPLDAPAVDVNLSPLTASSSRQPPGVPSPSALARWGSTTVICNITPTIVYPDAVQGSAATTTSSQSASTIVPSISLTPLSSPSSDFKSGPPSEYAQHIAERLFAFLDAGLPFDKSVLNIATDGDDEDSRVRAKWCLFADCSVIGFDGGLLEASFLAIVAALRQCKQARRRRRACRWLLNSQRYSRPSRQCICPRHTFPWTTRTSLHLLSHRTIGVSETT